MSRSRTVELQALAAEVVRRRSTAVLLPARWDLIGRWRQRRYHRHLVDAPLQQLRQAVDRAERGASQLQ
jgi:hypothetical protein